MKSDETRLPSRRSVLAGAGALAATAPLARPAVAQGAPLKVGLMLPFSGTWLPSPSWA